MKTINKIKFIFLSVIFSNIFGCTTINAIIPPSTDLKFTVASDVNPDKDGRASPVVAKIFELSSRTIFDTQDFFTLYEDAESVLGPDLIKRDELEFQPLEIKDYKMSLNKNTRYVGIVVAYRNIDGARWRSVVEVDPTDYDTVEVNIEKLAVYTLLKNNIL